MSQRSARMAAATATAEVSDPPRPSVVIRLVCGKIPWKPAMTATSLRSLKRVTNSLPSMSRIRAEAWASLVLIGICHPCQERAWTPIACNADRRFPRRYLLAGRHHCVIFTRVVHGRSFTAPFDQLVGLAGHRRDDDGNVMAGIDLALDVTRDVANAFDVGD